jgi:plastocyanin
MSKPSVRSAVTVAIAVLLFVAAAATTVAAQQSRPTAVRATKTVKAIGTSWSPTTTRLSAGGAIRWKAISGTHTATAYGGNWRFDRNLSAGDAVRHTFRHAGTFRFRCRIHSSLVSGRCSGMCGKVVVRS